MAVDLLGNLCVRYELAVGIVQLQSCQHRTAAHFWTSTEEIARDPSYHPYRETHVSRPRRSAETWIGYVDDDARFRSRQERRQVTDCEVK